MSPVPHPTIPHHDLPGVRCLVPFRPSLGLQPAELPLGGSPRLPGPLQQDDDDRPYGAKAILGATAQIANTVGMDRGNPLNELDIQLGWTAGKAPRVPGAIRR